jgi:hypothetical protein
MSPFFKSKRDRLLPPTSIFGVLPGLTTVVPTSRLWFPVAVDRLPTTLPKTENRADAEAAFVNQREKPRLGIKPPSVFSRIVIPLASTGRAPSWR